jgi:hypothetical protein
MEFDPEATGYIELRELQPLLARLHGEYMKIKGDSKAEEKYQSIEGAINWPSSDAE